MISCHKKRRPRSRASHPMRSFTSRCSRGRSRSRSRTRRRRGEASCSSGRQNVSNANVDFRTPPQSATLTPPPGQRPTSSGTTQTARCCIKRSVNPCCKPRPVNPCCKRKKRRCSKKRRSCSRASSRASSCASTCCTCDSDDSSCCCASSSDDNFPSEFLWFILTMNSTANYYKCNASYQASYYRACLEQEKELTRRKKEREAEEAANVTRLDVECLEQIIANQGESVLCNKEVAITLRPFNKNNPVSENPLIDLHSLKLFANGEKETECCCEPPPPSKSKSHQCCKHHEPNPCCPKSKPNPCPEDESNEDDECERVQERGTSPIPQKCKDASASTRKKKKKKSSKDLPHKNKERRPSSSTEPRGKSKADRETCSEDEPKTTTKTETRHQWSCDLYAKGLFAAETLMRSYCPKVEEDENGGDCGDTPNREQKQKQEPCFTLTPPPLSGCATPVPPCYNYCPTPQAPPPNSYSCYPCYNTHPTCPPPCFPPPPPPPCPTPYYPPPPPYYPPSPYPPPYYPPPPYPNPYYPPPSYPNPYYPPPSYPNPYYPPPPPPCPNPYFTPPPASVPSPCYSSHPYPCQMPMYYCPAPVCVEEDGNANNLPCIADADTEACSRRSNESMACCGPSACTTDDAVQTKKKRCQRKLAKKSCPFRPTTPTSCNIHRKPKPHRKNRKSPTRRDDKRDDSCNSNTSSNGHRVKYIPCAVPQRGPGRSRSRKGRRKSSLDRFVTN